MSFGDGYSLVIMEPTGLGGGLEWQMGPAYLRKPVSEGPIRTDIMTGSIELPTEEVRKQYRTSTVKKILSHSFAWVTLFNTDHSSMI